MALKKTFLGFNEDGSPHFHYETDGHVVVTGPVFHPITLSDGTTYDTAPDVIEVASPEHAAELAHLIGEHHAANGHPKHAPGDPFIHVPNPNHSEG